MKYVPCLGYKHDCGADGWDYDCEYEKATFECDNCICNGGNMSPISGKQLSEKFVNNYISKYLSYLFSENHEYKVIDFDFVESVFKNV